MSSVVMTQTESRWQVQETGQQSANRRAKALGISGSTAGWMLAAAADFHDTRFLGLFAIFAAVLTDFLGRARADTVLTLSSCFFGH